MLEREKAFGFGTMSIHEIETDQRPGSNLGYIAWYAIGLKVVKWNENGIKSMGTYRDVGGNDFWGVSLEPRKNGRSPLIHMSDRDSGLWIFEYTGRGS